MYMGQQPLMMNSMAMIPKPSAPEMKEDTGSTTTNCLILSNMFNSKDLKGHALADLKDEVEGKIKYKIKLIQIQFIINIDINLFVNSKLKESLIYLKNLCHNAHFIKIRLKFINFYIFR